MADGNAGERARLFTTTDARIDVGSVAQRRIESHGDERVDDRVHALDLRDVRSRHLDGGNFTRLDEAREIDGVAPNDVVVHEGQYRFRMGNEWRSEDSESIGHVRSIPREC